MNYGRQSPAGGGRGAGANDMISLADIWTESTEEIRAEICASLGWSLQYAEGPANLELLTQQQVEQLRGVAGNNSMDSSIAQVIPRLSWDDEAKVWELWGDPEDWDY